MNDTLYPQSEPQLPEQPLVADPTTPTFTKPQMPACEAELPQEPILQQPPESEAKPELEVTREPIGMQEPVYEPLQEATYVRPEAPRMQSPYFRTAGMMPPKSVPPVPPTHCPPTPPQMPTQTPKQEEKKPKQKRGVWKLVLGAVACVLLGAVCSGIVFYVLNDKEPSSKTETPTVVQATQNPTTTAREPAETKPRPTVSGEALTLAEVYQNNVPAIVGISNEATYNVFGQTSTTASTGTGFIISEDGEILTNYHVVEGADSLTVTMYDGTEYPATLLGYEAESDVALIKIEAENLSVCALGDSDTIYVGEQIAAIGNPLGELTYTMTVGYVSAMDRFVNTDGTPINMMQVDAAINPGNSGGPIFNMRGEVIGIATAKYSGTISGGATIEGIGFAIPINDVLEILDDLRNDGAVLDRAYMGVVVSTLHADSADYGIDYGVYIQSVEENGSAYAAGIQAGDIIIAVGDTKIEAYENLQQELRKYRAGDQSTITVYRSGQTIQLPITFSAKPLQTQEVQPETTQETSYYDPWGDFPFGGFGW